MTERLFDIYSHNVCNGGDIPGWLALAICALPFLLLAIDAFGG